MIKLAQKQGVRPKRKLTEDTEQKIKSHLDENEEKRRKGLRKQFKKTVDIFEALNEEEISISYITVLRTVRKLEKKPKQIKESYEPGDICEFDWGVVRVTIGENQKPYKWVRSHLHTEITAMPDYLPSKPQNAFRRHMRCSSKR